MMLLHAGAPLAPHDAWKAWNFEPGVVIPLALTAVVYARGARESLSMVAGYPAIDAREWRRAAAVYRRLPELKKRIEELEQQLAHLKRSADRA